MSIDPILMEHERSGALIRVESDREEVRRLFISPDVARLLEGPWPSKEEERRCAYLEYDLVAFVGGAWTGVCMSPRHANEDAGLAILAPPEHGVWDLRSVDPDPGLRVIGMFGAPDLFIGLRWAPRSVPWWDRLPLLDFASREWRSQILNARADWERLFPGLAPYYVGDNPHDYLTSKAHRV